MLVNIQYAHRYRFWPGLIRIHTREESISEYEYFRWSGVKDCTGMGFRYWMKRRHLLLVWNADVWYGMQAKRRGRLPVTNLSSENNLPTFRLNAPVIIFCPDDNWSIQAKHWQVIFEHRLVTHNFPLRLCRTQLRSHWKKIQALLLLSMYNQPIAR